MIDACNTYVFVINENRPPYTWERCVTCGWPKAQHEMPHCRNQATFRGEIFECQRRSPHVGKCKSGDAEWGGDG